MIFVFAEGGTGSVYFSQCINVGVRPDTVWGFKPEIKAKPKGPSVGFTGRSGVPLDAKKTIEENLVDMLKWREDEGKHTMLSGRCSQLSNFLTENKVPAICIVRHPLHAFVSFLGHRHPEHAQKFGGINTLQAVHFYAGIWNAMLDDFIKSKNRIYRFEYMPDEILESWLQEKLKGWNNQLRHYNAIDKNLEEELELLTSNNYYSLYEDWEI